jgi:predicted RNA-binding protein with PIN domain
MHEEVWLIDGYNLIHALDGKTSALDRPVSTGALLNRLNNFASGQSIKIVFILDGVGNTAEFDAFKTDRMEIRYSQDISADTFIERLLQAKKPGLSCAVITNDRALCSMTRGLGSRVFNSRELLAMLADASADQENKIFRQSVKSHGFNRPFNDLLSKKGF